jgi:hypothetical protein
MAIEMLRSATLAPPYTAVDCHPARAGHVGTPDYHPTRAARAGAPGLSKLEERTPGRCRLILLDQSGAARLRRTTPWTVVLTYTKGGLSYKVVLASRDCVVRRWRSLRNQPACSAARSGEFHSWPLGAIPFRNSEGVILACFLNAVLNADFELKPTSSDTARIE